jgi:hypothetical protein
VHFFQEDSPDEIGAALANFVRGPRGPRSALATTSSGGVRLRGRHSQSVQFASHEAGLEIAFRGGWTEPSSGAKRS